MTKKTLLKTITTHTKNYHAYRNQRLTEIVEEVISKLTVRTNELQDAVVALSVANHDISRQAQETIQGIRNEQDPIALDNHINNLVEQQALNTQIENVLFSLNEEREFSSLYRKNQFYHMVNRFIRAEKMISEGYHFMFTHQNQQGEFEHVLVNVDADTQVSDLFDTVFFGFLMEEPKTREEAEQRILFIGNNSTADIVTDSQTEEIKKSVKSLTVFSSTKLLQEYLEKARHNINIQE